MKYLILAVSLCGGCAYSKEFKSTHDMDKLAACAEQAALQCERESRKVTVNPATDQPKAEEPVN